MKEIVGRLFIIHLAVVVLAALGGAFWGGWQGAWSAASGAFSFSLPVVAFSFLVLKASSGDQKRFLGRFMVAELLKWATAAAFLALAFVSGIFQALPLLVGFVLSVLVQVFFPIFLRKESES
jgi:F0F1-type ATP synthase assembly protein I